jgi:hypothetical protein
MTQYILSKVNGGFRCRSKREGFLSSYGCFGKTAREAYTWEQWKNRLTSGSDTEKLARYPLPGFICGVPKRLRR